MGDYVYALRAPGTMRTCVVERQDGETETLNVGCFQYVYKPHRSNLNRHYDIPYVAILSKMDKKWENIPNKIPEFFVFTDNINSKIAVGNSVYHIPGKRVTSFSDGSANYVFFGTIVSITRSQENLIFCHGDL